MAYQPQSGSSQLADIFREAIMPGIADTRLSTDSESMPLLALLTENGKEAVKTYNPQNKEYLQKVKTGSVTAYAGNEDSAYISGGASYDEMTVPIRQTYIRSDITDFLRAVATGADSSSIVNYASSIMGDIVDGKKRYINKYAHGSTDAVITTVTTGAGPGTSLVLVVADNTDIEIGDELNIDTTTNLDAGSDSTLTVFTVTAKSGTTGLTVSCTSDTVANGDSIVRRYSRNSAGTKVIEGMDNLINNTGTIFGQNRATTPAFAAYRDNTGEALSTSGNMLEAARSIKKYGGDQQVILASPYAWTKFYSLNSSQLRQKGNLSEMVVGGVPFQGLEYVFANNTIVVLDEYEPDTVASTSGAMNFIAKDALVYAEVGSGYDLGAGGMGVQGYNSDGNPTPNKSVLYHCFHQIAFKNAKKLARLTAKT